MSTGSENQKSMPESVDTARSRRWYRDISILSLVAASIAVVISIISLKVSFGQLDVAARQNRAAAEASLYAQCNALSDFFLHEKNVHLHRYFFGVFDKAKDQYVPLQPPDDQSEEDKARMELLAEAQTDLFESVIQTADVLEDDDRESWYDYIAAVYARSPYMKTFIDRNDTSYTTRLKEFALNGVRPSPKQ